MCPTETIDLNATNVILGELSESRYNFAKLVSQKITELMTNIPEKIKNITNDRVLFNLSKIKRTTKSLVMLTELRVLVNFIYGALRY